MLSKRFLKECPAMECFITRNHWKRDAKPKKQHSIAMDNPPSAFTGSGAQPWIDQECLLFNAFPGRKCLVLKCNNCNALRQPRSAWYQCAFTGVPGCLVQTLSPERGIQLWIVISCSHWKVVHYHGYARKCCVIKCFPKSRAPSWNAGGA